ncbi:MAG: hypothetical protein WC545_01295 [Patescibacteria group bacterium]
MEEERKKKIFLLRVGVSILAVLILFFWILNLQGLWRVAGEKNGNSNQEWEEMQAELGRTIEEINIKMDNLKTEAEIVAAEKAAEDKNEAGDKAEAGEVLINDLIEKTKADNDSGADVGLEPDPDGVLIPAEPEEPNSDGVFIPEESKNLTENPNCPAYINCMPTYDSPPRPCVIPPGCEGITQIAY